MEARDQSLGLIQASTLKPSRFVYQRSLRHLLLSSLIILGLCGAGPFAPAALPPINGFVYPLSGTRVSSDYGIRKHPVHGTRRHHHGMDLAAPEGAAVRSIAGGVVIFSGRNGGYGNLVVVAHASGLSSHYGHLQSIAVELGKRIKAGQLIGRVGSTGISTGPHLHFEIRSNGEVQDPEKYIPGLAAAGEG